MLANHPEHLRAARHYFSLWCTIFELSAKLLKPRRSMEAK
jgi:hypothetical protein